MNSDDITEMVVMVGEMAMVVGLIIFAMLLIFLPIAGVIAMFNYKQSCIASEIYNKKHQTTYSCSDFFWAGKVFTRCAP